MYEAQKKHGTGTDQELIDVLTAISVVSKRLAMKWCGICRTDCSRRTCTDFGTGQSRSRR